MPDLWLLLLGFAVGAYGTLIGAGGGFVLVPILLLLYPRDSPTTITSISLAVVFFNALSGTIAYARQRRVDYRTGLLFSVATIPGAIAGALATTFLNRGVFDLIFGTLLIIIALAIGLRPRSEDAPEGTTLPGYTLRTLTDGVGQTYSYAFDQRLGLLISFGVGFFSSILGIGGGIIHVPALIHLLNFPAHIATATSHFILAIMAFTGTTTHIVTGEFTRGTTRTLLLALGVVPGAQLGAWLSPRIRGPIIIRLLAGALALVGLRLILAAF